MSSTHLKSNESWVAPPAEEMAAPEVWLCSWPWHLQVLVTLTVLHLLRLRTVHYYACYAAYIVLTLGFSLFYIPVFMLSPRSPANITLIKPFASLISRIVGIRWELRDAEHLEVDRAGVLVGNHQSLFDALGIAEIAPSLKKCVSISRKEIFYYWPFGLSAWLSGVVFIDRHDRRKAMDTLLGTCPLLLRHKAKLIIFPEGTRNRDGNTLLPFKKGAFRVAIASQTPVLPIVYSPYYFINADKKSFNGGHMIIKALPPIPTAGLTMDDLDLLIDKTWNTMTEHYKLLNEEIHEEMKVESGKSY